MATISWDPQTMATGIPEVDAQHQEWIRRYNQFDDAIHQGKGIEVVQSTLDFFIEYADVHFKYEESVMDELHCPAAKDNCASHEHIRNILHGYKSQANKCGCSISDVHGLKIRMEEWLVKHILTIDIQLRDSQAIDE
jgi:hemerythrin-like metal-binding protein